MLVPSIKKRWFVDTTQFQLKWHQLDAYYAVFHTGSAETHVLDELSANCLQFLYSTPLNVPELCDKLSRSFALELDDDLYEYVDDIILQFESLGLIEQQRASV